MLDIWPIVSKYVFASLQEAWKVKKMSITQRRGLLHLIPKAGKDPLGVKNWRPIMVLNMDYKILTKVCGS